MDLEEIILTWVILEFNVYCNQMRQNHGKCMQMASPKLVNSKKTISINLSKEHIFSQPRKQVIKQKAIDAQQS